MKYFMLNRDSESDIWIFKKYTFLYYILWHLISVLTLVHNSVVVGEEFLPFSNVSEWYKHNTAKRPLCVLAVVDIGQTLAKLNGKLFWHVILLVAHISRPLIRAVVHILTHSQRVLWTVRQPAGVTHHVGPYSVPATARPKDHLRDAFIISIN